MEQPFDPVAALVAFHKALDSFDVAGVSRMMAWDATYDSPGLGQVKGRDAITASMASYFATSPDHQAWDDEVFATGPRSAGCRWRLRATNKQTGVVVERHGTEAITFNKYGLITSVVVKDEG